MRPLLSFCILLALASGCTTTYNGRTKVDQHHYTQNFDAAFAEKTGDRTILVFERYGTGLLEDSVISRSSYPANELVVCLRPNKTAKDITALLSSAPLKADQFQIVDSLAGGEVYLIRSPSKDIISLKDRKAALERSGLFRYTEPNFIYHADQSNQFAIKIDKAQWYLRNTAWYNDQADGIYDADVDGIEAMSRYKYGQEVKHPVLVAVIDGGINAFHQALIPSLYQNPNEIPGNNKDDDGNKLIDDVHGWNFASNNSSLADGANHGTHVSGIIAAQQPHNIEMVTGIAPDAKIMVLKCGETIKFEGFAILKSLKYAINKRAQIINMSFGDYIYSQALADGVAEAISHEIIMVASAGNDKKNISVERYYPACLPKVISVAATDKNDSLSTFSNFGNEVRIAAPGTDIFSTVPSGYGMKSGTSMAAPIATAAIALIKSIHPTDDLTAIIKRLGSGADEIAGLKTKVMNGARLNIYRSLFQGVEQVNADGIPYRDQPYYGYTHGSATPYANWRDPGVDGKTPQTAFKISHISQLMNIRDADLGAYFKLTGNLDWHELPSNQRQIFTRTFNGTLFGDGFSIRNFDVQTAYPTGLFLRLGPNAAIYDLRLTGVNIKGSTTVGALASTMEGGTLSNVQVEGTVNGDQEVGGIVGKCINAHITRCYFEGSVSSQKNPAGTLPLGTGGIAGSSSYSHFLGCHVQAQLSMAAYGGGIAGLLGSSTINDCYAHVRINGEEHLGGLAGRLYRTDVSNSYAEGFVKASVREAGGLAGYIQLSKLVNCYAMVDVPKTNFGGGLLGNGHSFNAQGCYYMEGNAAGIGGSAIGYFDMQDPARFPGWFEANFWRSRPGFSPLLPALPRTFSSIAIN